MEHQLNISGVYYDLLKNHLFPNDGKEAVAVALCGRFKSDDKEILLVQDVTLIPIDVCFRTENEINWPTDRIHHYFEKISSKLDYAILKIHSHPGGFGNFSETDNISDAEFFSSVFGWSNSDNVHASAVMLPSGEIFGRVFAPNLIPSSIDSINIAGDQIRVFKINQSNLSGDSIGVRTEQAFGEETYNILRNLKIGLVGCSGTGSIVIEQLNRLQVGKLVLVDPDVVELKNLNRILNSTYNDAINKVPKVFLAKKAISRIGLNTKIDVYRENVYSSVDTLKELIKCDIIFGCVDSVDGRHLLNQLCSFYVLPYFDLGVKLEADSKGGINKICGTVHYIQPHKSSLLSRGLYTMEDLRAASQYRQNPAEYDNLLKDSYIKNVNVNNPAVISVNMQIASHAVNELLNRLHPYKSEAPSSSAQSTIDITGNYIVNVDEQDLQIDNYLSKKVGIGDTTPFIEISELK